MPHGVPRLRNEGVRPAGEEEGGRVVVQCLVMMTISLGPEPTAVAGSMQVLDDPARFFVGGMKISECKANNPTPQSSHAHMPGIWMGSRPGQVGGAGGGGGVGEHPITSLQQGRNGCEAGPAAAEVCWAGSGSGVRGSGFGVASLGLGKIHPSSPTQLSIFGWVEPHAGAYPGHTPVGTAHQHIQYTPDSLLQSPSPSLFPLRPSPRSRARHSPLRS